MTDLQAILDKVFNTDPLYMGLVDLTNFTGFDPTTDTMSSHAGWQEFTSYSETTRPLWVPTDPLDTYPASINNPMATTFTPTAAGQVYGVFLCDNATKGGTTGQLYGPYFFQLGGRNTVALAPFTVNLSVSMERNNPWVN